MESIWMEGLEGRRFFSVSVTPFVIMVPISVTPIDMGDGSGSGASAGDSGGDAGDGAGSGDDGSIDSGGAVDGGTVDGSTDGSTDDNNNSADDSGTDPVLTDPSGGLDGTVQIMTAGAVNLSAQGTAHLHHHHHHVKNISSAMKTSKSKHHFNVASRIGAHTRASFLMKRH